MSHLTRDQLDAGLSHIQASPTEVGTLEMIVRRPAVDEREVVDRAELVVGRGVVGDNYVDRPSRTQPDGGPNPDAEITLMNARIIDVITGGDRSRWPLAGDQLYVDLDLSSATCPAGTRLEVGSVVLEVTDHPHTGCQKFSRRFGLDARKWLNVNRTDERRRGIYARVVTAGEVTTGDQIRVVS